MPYLASRAITARYRAVSTVDGGAAARELDVDDTEIQRDDLLGHRGAQAQERALQKLRKLVS